MHIILHTQNTPKQWDTPPLFAFVHAVGVIVDEFYSMSWSSVNNAHWTWIYDIVYFENGHKNRFSKTGLQILHKNKLNNIKYYLQSNYLHIWHLIMCSFGQSIQPDFKNPPLLTDMNEDSSSMWAHEALFPNSFVVWWTQPPSTNILRLSSQDANDNHTIFVRRRRRRARCSKF